jgi:hypothetical protein
MVALGTAAKVLEVKNLTKPEAIKKLFLQESPRAQKNSTKRPLNTDIK